MMKRITTILWSALCLSFLVCLPSFGQVEWVERTNTYFNSDLGFSWKLPGGFEWKGRTTDKYQTIFTSLSYRPELFLWAEVYVDDKLPKVLNQDIWERTVEKQELDTVNHETMEVKIFTTTKVLLGGHHAEKTVIMPLLGEDDKMMSIVMRTYHNGVYIRPHVDMRMSTYRILQKQPFNMDAFFKGFAFDD